MRAEDIQPECEKRTKMIRKIFEQVEKQIPLDNKNVKEQIEENYTSLETLYGNYLEVDEIVRKCELKLEEYLLTDFIAYDERNEKLKKITREMFKSIFNDKRATALINILKPINDKVYRKEGIESLKFDKEEIIKGFRDETLEKDNLAELRVKLLFWLNKYVKIMEMKMISKLKATPITTNSETNFFNAKKRLEIIKLINESFDKETADVFRKNFEEEYFSKFGVGIKEDMETLKDLHKIRNSIYELKNTMMASLMSDFMFKLKIGQEIGGIQAMGVTKNDVGLSDSTGSYMAVIRLKGYTSNIYLHTPSQSYAEAVWEAGAHGLDMLIPSSTYSELSKNKIIPVNVICKVEKNSERYKKIKKEQKEKPNNQALKQAVMQINGTKLKPHQIANWRHERAEGIPMG